MYIKFKEESMRDMTCSLNLQCILLTFPLFLWNNFYWNPCAKFVIHFIYQIFLRFILQFCIELNAESPNKTKDKTNFFGLLLTALFFVCAYFVWTMVAKIAIYALFETWCSWKNISIIIFDSVEKKMHNYREW